MILYTKSTQSDAKQPAIVYVDKFTVRGKEKGRIEVELNQKHQIKRVYVKSIEDYSSKSLTPIFEQHISKSAQIVTEKLQGITHCNHAVEILN